MITILYDGKDSDRVFSKLIRKLLRRDLTIIPLPSYDYETETGLHVSPTLNHLVRMMSSRINRMLGSHKIAYTLREFNFTKLNMSDLDLVLTFLNTIWISKGRSLTELYEKIAKSLRIPVKLMPLYDPPPYIIVKMNNGEKKTYDIFSKIELVESIKEISYGNLDKAKIVMETRVILENSKVILLFQVSPISLYFLKSVGSLKKTLENFKGTIIYFLPQKLTEIDSILLQKLGYKGTLEGLVKMSHEQIDAIIVDDQNQELISDLSEIKLTLYPAHYGFNNKNELNKFVNDLLKILK